LSQISNQERRSGLKFAEKIKQMKLQASFSKLTAFAAILSCPVALLSLFMVFGAFNWDFDVAFDPAKAIAYLPDPSQTLRLGWLLDLLGFYLLLLPAAIFLEQYLSKKAPLHSRLFSICGLGYLLFGALGAAMMAGTCEPVFAAHQSGDVVQKAAAAAVFANTFHEVFDGIWNQFSMLLAAVWLLGTGWLMRPELRWLSWMTSLIGIASLLDFLGMVAGSEAVSGIGLNIYLWLGPIWALWLGIAICRGKMEIV